MYLTEGVGSCLVLRRRAFSPPALQEFYEILSKLVQV